MAPEEGLEKQIEIYRKMQPWERLQVSFRLYDEWREGVRAEVKCRFPDSSETQVQREVLRRVGIANGIPSELLPPELSNAS